MNETIKTIQERRAVRFFDSRAVPKQTLDTIIACGNLAPSGFNTQQWRFVVVQSDACKATLLSLALPIYQQWLEKASDEVKERRRQVDSQTTDPIYYSAPVVVFVIGKGMTADYDCPMVCENMMLAARSFGIGSCWVYFGMLPAQTPEIQKLFDIRDGEKIYGPILLGYPRESFPDSPPKKEPEVKWI